MTNNSGFGQTETERIQDAANYARTADNMANRSEAQNYLSALESPARNFTDLEGGTGNLTSETDDLKTTYLPDQSLGDQAVLQELTNKQNMLNMEVAAELDRVNTEFFTDLDIRKAQSIAGETRAGQRVGGEEARANLAEEGAQTRATSRVAGQEQRAGYAEQGSQLRATERVSGQEDRARTAEEGSQTRATSRVAGQEQRAGIAEEGSQTRGTRRVEGQEVRETDLQREMFRRYKEARDYDQAQRGARSY